MNKYQVVKKLSRIAIPYVLSNLNCDRLPTVPSVRSSTAKVEEVESTLTGFFVTVTYYVDGSGPSGTKIFINDNFEVCNDWEYGDVIWTYKSAKSIWD